MIIVKVGYPVADNVRFVAFDGKIFRTQIECRTYEINLVEKMNKETLEYYLTNL